VVKLPMLWVGTRMPTVSRTEGRCLVSLEIFIKNNAWKWRRQICSVCKFNNNNNNNNSLLIHILNSTANSQLQSGQILLYFHATKWTWVKGTHTKYKNEAIMIIIIITISFVEYLPAAVAWNSHSLKNTLWMENIK
jgi:hypothetical protein